MIDWLMRISHALGITWGDLVWGLVIFLVASAGSLFLLGFVVVKLPAEYFCGPAAGGFWAGRHPAVRCAARIGKNLAGALLIILGAVMALPGVPGPGLLVALGGIMLTDIPGKRRLDRWVLSRPGVLARINRLRARFDKPPMFLENNIR